MEGHMRYLSNTASLELLTEKCTGCGKCIEVCPHGVFGMEDRKAVILDRDRCMECGACANNCAFGALRVDKGVGCAAAIINGMITGGEPSCGCGGKGGTGCCG
jgi:NAD-dependent dihydropyrimidine dehydrogenase PreA subunit